MTFADQYIEEVEGLVADGDRVRALLGMEKERRGVPETQLTFIGVHNVANYRWCALHSVRKSRAEEWRFFGSYLHDRLTIAPMMGLACDLPSDPLAILELAAAEMPFDQVDEILSESIDDATELDTANLVARENEGTEYLEPENQSYRWNWPWQDYVLVGIPDGLTRDTVLEAKSTNFGAVFARRFQKPVAFVQADIYGMCFRRPKKRILLISREDGQHQEFHADVDVTHGELTLANFRKVDREDWMPPAPSAWKCRNCDTAEGCPHKQ